MKVYFLQKGEIKCHTFQEERFKDLKNLYNKRESAKITETINSDVEISYYEENNKEVREVNVNSYEKYERVRLTPINSDEESSNIKQFIKS
jgi:hypothetical protein